MTAALHHRWFCDACQREWTYAYGWTPEQGCPACHATTIRRETYQPTFPGGDLPRSQAELVVASTPLPTSDETPRAQRNQTLSLSSPEFA